MNYHKFAKLSITEPYDMALVLKELEDTTLTDEVKYKVLKSHFKADQDFTFPEFLYMETIFPVA